jgi:hypothetical protein
MLIALGLVASVPPAYALDYEWQDVKVTLNNRWSAGAAWRMEDRDDALIGILNVDGQQNLCAGDDCLSFEGDPAPNQRLVDAKGAFLGHTFDDGNLNYDKHDLVAGATKLTTDLAIGWQNYAFKARGVGFYDTVNRGRKDFHPNTIHQPAETSRLDSVERDVGADYDLYELFAQGQFTVGGREVVISVGNQTVRWGESNFIALNGLNEINPPDENRLWLPGGQINEVFQPVPLAVVSADLVENVSMEAFYQFGWEPVIPAAAGSFMSSFESAGGADHVIITQGQVPEDPNGEHRFAGVAALISDSSTRAAMLKGFGDAEDGGQFGLRLNWFAEDFNGGTDFGFYAMNYHSRVPYLGTLAAQESCMRNSLTFVDAAVSCNAFNGALRQQIGDTLGIDTLLPAREPLPFDTIKLFLDYPEDIQMYGVSFNTNVGKWSLAGEYAFRPNVPVQVSLVDVLMAAAQPAFPRMDIPVGVAPVVLGTVPGARSIVPDFLSGYRGFDNSDPNNDINGGQLIRGYERLHVGQLGLTGLKTISSSNPIKADQIIILIEAGLTHVTDLPDKDELQMEGYVLHKNSHASPGADGTGTNGVPDSRRLNPTQQTDGFADDFATGYRVLGRFEYNDVIEGINFMPWLGWFHDVKGISVGPMQNFIEGRKNFLVGTEFNLDGGWSGALFYYGFAGSNNVVRDRDFLTFSVNYTF